MSAHADKLWVALGPIGDTLAIALAAWVVFGLIWHFWNEWREKNEKPRLSFEPSYLLVLCLAGALFAAIWQQVRGTSATASNAGTKSSVSTLARDLIVSHDTNSISLRGTFATDELIEVRVQYKSVRSNNPMQTYSVVLTKGQSSTVRITELKSFSGNPLAVTLLSDASADGNPSLRWGSDKYGSPPDQFPNAEGMIARVLLVGTSNKPEVYSYFLLVPKITAYALASLPAPRRPLLDNLILVPQEAIDAAKNWD